MFNYTDEWDDEDDEKSDSFVSVSSATQAVFTQEPESPQTTIQPLRLLGTLLIIKINLLCSLILESCLDHIKIKKII